MWAWIASLVLLGFCDGLHVCSGSTHCLVQNATTSSEFISALQNLPAAGTDVVLYLTPPASRGGYEVINTTAVLASQSHNSSASPRISGRLRLVGSGNAHSVVVDTAMRSWVSVRSICEHGSSKPKTNPECMACLV